MQPREEKATIKSPIGRAITRIDGRRKVTGHAPYGVEYPIKNVAYGVGVPSTIGNGRITRMDSSVAEKMPGVLAVLHHGNFQKLFRPAGDYESQSHTGESRPPFEDENIYYYGQFVALVIAETFEQAQDAASHVRVEYEAKPPLLRIDRAPAPGTPPAEKSVRGNAETAMRQAPVKLDATYVTPVETHNPMEMHGTIAVWNKDKLTLYETTQGIVNHHNVASQVMGMPP